MAFGDSLRDRRGDVVPGEAGLTGPVGPTSAKLFKKI